MYCTAIRFSLSKLQDFISLVMICTEYSSCFEFHITHFAWIQFVWAASSPHGTATSQFSRKHCKNMNLKRMKPCNQISLFSKLVKVCNWEHLFGVLSWQHFPTARSNVLVLTEDLVSFSFSIMNFTAVKSRFYFVVSLPRKIILNVTSWKPTPIYKAVLTPKLMVDESLFLVFFSYGPFYVSSRYLFSFPAF